jgi:hypothetical protein
MPVRKVHVMDFSTRQRRIQHGLGFYQRPCQRFFTEDVLAVSKGRYGLIRMECIGSDYRHCIYIRLRTKLLVVRVYSRDSELIGYGVRAVGIPPTYGHDFSLGVVP